MHNLWKNYTILNDIDSERFSNRCFRGHNSHPRVSVLCFSSFSLKETICTPKLYNKNIDHHARLRENDRLFRCRP